MCFGLVEPAIRARAQTTDLPSIQAQALQGDPQEDWYPLRGDGELVYRLHKQSSSQTKPQLFFDDEHRNFEVESLGVTMQFITDGTGRKAFNEGLALWRKRRGIKIVSKDSLAESRQEHHHD